MKKFKVTFSLDYEVEARSKAEAIELAEDLLVEEAYENHFGFTEIFTTKVLPCHEDY